MQYCIDIFGTKSPICGHEATLEINIPSPILYIRRQPGVSNGVPVLRGPKINDPGPQCHHIPPTAHNTIVSPFCDKSHYSEARLLEIALFRGA